VYEKPKASRALPTALPKIANKVVGRQLLPAPPAGTEQLIPFSHLLKFSGVLSMLNQCSAVPHATALGHWAVENVNSLSTAMSQCVQLTVLWVIGPIGALATNRVLIPDLIAETVLVFNTDLEKFWFDLRMVARTALSFVRLDLATNNLAPLTVSSRHGHLGVSAHQDVVVVSNCALVISF
jgi:hypothetical protein